MKNRVWLLSLINWYSAISYISELPLSQQPIAARYKNNSIDVQKRRKLSIPSHSPMGQWDIPRDVYLSVDACVCPTVHPIPWSHGTVGLSIISHGPMEQWDIPWDVHMSLLQILPLFFPFHDPMKVLSQWTLRVKLERTREVRGAISVRLAERRRHTLTSRLSKANEVSC